MLALPLVAGTAAGHDVSLTVTGLRSAKGLVRACLTAQPRAFPDCDRDAAARYLAVPAGDTVLLDFGPMPAGRYAVAVFHDENENGKLDKRLLMPREGYGFSRDAAVRFGPPKFAAAAFEVASDTTQSLRMRYMF